jgi:colanic acid/amylovoran biosynthesis protein
VHIVLTGITGLRNRGVEAIVVPSLQNLRERVPDLTVTVLTQTPDYDRLRLEPFGATAVRDALIRSSGNLLRSVLGKSSRLCEALSSEHRRTAQTLRSADLVVAAGGDVFTSDYGGSLRTHLRPLRIALDAGVAVVFLAQSIGPFRTRGDTEAWLAVGRRARLCTVREECSYHYLINELGLPKERVHHTADPAFLLDPASPETVAHLRRVYGLDTSPTIALGVSQGIARYVKTDADRHVEAWLAVIRMLVDELAVQVMLFPHVQEVQAGNDDRILATLLMRRLGFDPRVRLMAGDHTAAEFKGVIGSCDLVISERMHGCIAGLSTGVGTLAVGYSMKAEGILTDLLDRETLRDGLLVPIDEFLSPDIAKAQVRRAWERRHEVADKLRRALPDVRKRSAANFDLIVGAMR